MARERLPEPAEERDPTVAVDPSVQRDLELSEARRPVRRSDRVKLRVSRSSRSSSSSACWTKHTASRRYCVCRRACVPGARSGTSLRQMGSSLPASVICIRTARDDEPPLPPPQRRAPWPPPPR